MREKILNILRELNPYEDIDEDSKLIEDGIIDSLTLVLLISEMESEFHVKIPEDKLRPEFFGNIPQIENLIKSLI